MCAVKMLLYNDFCSLLWQSFYLVSCLSVYFDSITLVPAKPSLLSVASKMKQS